MHLALKTLLNRVELDRCRQCGHLMPTPEGQAKVKRCVKVGKKIFLKSLD